MNDPARSRGDTVVVSLRGPIARVELNRPEKLNAINEAMLDALGHAIALVNADERVRVLVLSGRGRAFCAGGDLDDHSVFVADPAAFDRFLDHWQRTFDALDQCRVPTIAAVHGFALAGGLELTHACDFVVLADDARLGDNHARYGLYPSGGSTQRLPRRIGERRALWLLMSGDRLSPSDALAWGLVNAVVPAAEVVPVAVSMAESLASKSPEVVQRLKRNVRLGRELSVQESIRQERPDILQFIASPEGEQGLHSFHGRDRRADS